MKMCKVVFVVVVLCCALGKCLAQDGALCNTPVGSPGVCISIKSCEPLLNVLRAQSNNPEVRNYLRKSACGFLGSVPLVCCPQTQRPLTSTTEQPPPVVQPSTPPPTAPVVDGRPELLRPPNCGFSNATTPRVVGGIDAKLGEFPWIAALGYRNEKNPNQPKWLCGGTLITERHILTAAHCVKNRDDLYIARLGDLDIYDDDDGASPVMVPIIKAKVHEAYDAAEHTSDIAILTLKFKPEAPLVWPVCLPLDEPLRSNKLVKYNLYVAGWGSTQFRGPSSSKLQVATLPVVETNQCRQALSKFRTVIDERVMCAGFPQGGKDACQGDSGGPYMYGVQGTSARYITFYLFGVVSYGYRCAEPGYPGVYTRVPTFIDWIQNNLN